MSEPAEKVASLRYGGPPIAVLWAWVVIDQDGQEALCRSPWSETCPLLSPDQDHVDSEVNAMWCRAFYEPHGMRVELRRFDLAVPE